MKPTSLRVRMLLNAAALISAALLLAGIGIYLQFKKHSEDIVLRHLDVHFKELVAIVEVNQSGELVLTQALSDPRFSQPYSGLYWQVTSAGKEALRSRSLWDDTLQIETHPDSHSDHVHEALGPDDVRLMAQLRSITLSSPGNAPLEVQLVIAVSDLSIINAQNNFFRDLLIGLGCLYAILLGGSWLQISRGMKPLKLLRSDLEAVRSGNERLLAGEYPKEVMPLVGELNGLLTARERQLERARQRAGNLAHGLKTPLTVIKTLSQTLRELGIRLIPDELDSSANIMRDLVRRELARARTAEFSETTRADIFEAVQKVLTALRPVTKDGVFFEMNISENCSAPLESADLIELVGNLLDNSRRYAHSIVRISAVPGQLIVEDDGPGVAPEKYDHILKRGARLDQFSGSGLGLSIVADLADVYGFTINLAPAQLGGLRVEIKWAASAVSPAPATPQPIPSLASSLDDRTTQVNSGSTQLLFNTK